MENQAELRITAQLAGVCCLLLLLTVLIPLSSGAADEPGGEKLRREFDTAKTYLVAGDLVHAETSYRHTVALGLRQLANLAVSEEKYEEAVGLLESALRVRPDDVEAQVDLGIVWTRRGDLDKARSYAQAAVAVQPDNPRAQNLFARIEFLRGDVNAAITQLRAALTLRDDFETAYYLALAYLKAKKPSEASVVFSEMLASMGSSAPLHVLIGRAYSLTGYPESAITEFRKAVKLDRQYPRAHTLLGFSYLEQFGEQGYAQARREFEEELKLRPEDYSTLLLLGMVAAGQRDYPAAELALEHAARLLPDSPAPYLYLGEAYSVTDRPTQAAAALGKFIAKTQDPQSRLYELSRAHFLLGQALLRLGRDAEAKKALARSQELREAKFKFDQEHMFEGPRQSMAGESRTSDRINELLASGSKGEPENVESLVTQNFPANPAAKGAPTPEAPAARQYRAFVAEILASSYNDLGVMLAKSERFADAAEYFRQAAHWNPTLEGLDRNQGLASFRANLYADAISPLERQLARQPNDAFVRRLLGLSYFLSDNYAKTAEVLRPLLENPPDDPGLLYAWGVALVRARQSGDAAKVFRILLERNANNPEVHLLLGQAYAQQEDYPHALDEINLALRLDAKLPQAQYYLGLVLLHQGQIAPASEAFRAEVQLNPADVVAKYHLAFAMLQQRQTDTAIALLHEVIRDNPGYEVAHYELGRALLLQGRVKEAIENLETARKLLPSRGATYYQLSLAYRRAGRAQDADQALLTYRQLRETSRSKQREILETEKP